MSPSKYLVVMVTCLIMITMGLSPEVAAKSPKSEPQTSQWAWLGENGGTYGYVPSEYLKAYTWDTDDPSNPNTTVPIDDQTVWHIEKFDDGFFFGPVVVKFEGQPALCQYMIGSVTPGPPSTPGQPGGRVEISFNGIPELPGPKSPTITTGTGEMVKQRGSWTFLMQMASGTQSTQVAHWAFMQQCIAGSDQPCWVDDFPGKGVDQTIQELLAGCGAI
ncbi:MAG TPA: hypothetical protein VLA60_03530 [Nitrospirales bacterium]|nr:hypothetical protein [Nitrospirales bacterium]